MTVRFSALFIPLCFCALNVPVFGQSTGQRIDADLDVFAQDAADIYSAPGRFDSKDWTLAGATIGLTVAAFFADEEVREFFQSRRPSGFDAIVEIGEVWGSPEPVSILGLGLYIGGMAADNASTRITGRMIIESVVLSGLATNILKVLLGRARPYTNEGAFSYHVLEIVDSKMSLPSGHATTAFAVSAVLAERINDPVASVLFYALASSTMFQRMNSDNHWLSDTILGAAIGGAIGYAVANTKNEKPPSATPSPALGEYPSHKPMLSFRLPLR